MAVRLPTSLDLGERPLPSTLRPIARVGNAGEAERANQEIGQAISKVGQTLYQRDAETQLEDFRTRLNRLELAKVHDPQNGFKAKRGKDAIDGFDQFTQEFGKAVDDEVATVGNPSARRAAAEMANSRRSQINASLSDYITQQRDVYQDDVYTAGVQSSRQRVSTDATAVTSELQNSQLATLAQVRRKYGSNADPALIKAALAENEAGLHAAVIDGYMSRKDYVGAYSYFDQHRASLGSKADDYAARTDAARQVVLTTAKTDEIVGKYGTGEKAYAAAKAIEDPVIRKNVEAAIDHEGSVRETLRARAERNVRVASSTKLYKADPLTPIEQVYSADELAAIDRQPGLREQLVREQTARIHGLEPVSDPREVDRLSTLAGTDAPAFMEADISKSYPKLSVPDREHFQALQVAMKDPSKQAEFATEQQQIARVYDTLGFKGGDKGDARRGAFQTAYQAEKGVFISQHKREPNADEREKIIKRITLPFVRSGWFSDKTVPAFEAKPGKDKVPDSDRLQITAAFKAQFKRAPSEQEISYYYALAH